MSVIVVNDSINTAGTITFWRMSGSIELTELTQAWKAAGFTQDLPTTANPKDALRRAAKKFQRRNLLARSLDCCGPKGNIKGWAFVDETTDGGNKLRHTSTLHVYANIVGRLEFERPGSGGHVRPTRNGDAEEHLAANVLNAYQANLETLAPTDMSSWLVSAVSNLQAIPLRDTGGFYFIPHPDSEKWQAMAKVICATTPHDIGLIPALKTEDAVRTILAALESEASSEADKILTQVASGKLGPTALQNRGDDVQRLITKVERYETLLNVTQPALLERLTELNGTLLAATLVAMPETEGS